MPIDIPTPEEKLAELVAKPPNTGLLDRALGLLKKATGTTVAVKLHDAPEAEIAAVKKAFEAKGWVVSRGLIDKKPVITIGAKSGPGKPEAPAEVPASSGARTRREG